MACNVTSAIGVNCKEAVGGVRRVFVATTDTNLVDSSDWTETSNAVTAIPATSFYQWDFHPEKCVFNARMQVNPEAGTIFYEQTLSLNIAHLDAADQEQLQLLAKAKPPIIVELNTGALLIMGARNGCDATGGGAASGQRFGDAQEMTIDLTAKEYDALVFHAAAGSDLADANYPLDNIANATLAS